MNAMNVKESVVASAVSLKCWIRIVLQEISSNSFQYMHQKWLNTFQST
jgi:uncharacterized membrane protein